MSYDDFEPNRVKHLEMIQAVVSRLGSNGFLIKGWAVTVAGAFIGLAANSGDCSFGRIGASVALVFWGLDAYFLSAERCFRALGDRVRKFDEAVPAFFMGATGEKFQKELTGAKQRETSWPGALTSGTLATFYGLLFLTQVIVAFMV